MGDYLPDTPDMSVDYCDLCEPERDPFEVMPNGKVLTVRRCTKHAADYAGSEDAIRTVTAEYLPSSGDADGRVSNTAACDIVHRSPKKRKKRA